MTKITITDTLLLSNSRKIPQLGFGVYRSSVDQCVQSCLTALQCGYRHIDTAQFYGNEKEVGEAVRQSGISRSDVFLTTKILTPGGSVEEDYQKCVESVNKLDASDDDSGYVDLFLIHSPNCGKEKRIQLWRALERLYQEGRARSIGVSNFGRSHIEELREIAKVWPPHVNQIEVCYQPSTCLSRPPSNRRPQLHPWNQQKGIVQYCHQNGTAIEAYCPLVRNTKGDDDTLVGIAKKHRVSPAQILIRYSLEKGWIPLPKSDDPSRIAANADVFNFSLDKEDMTTLDGLDQGRDGAIVQAVDG